MKKLRLLLFEECNRKCKGCCNNDWNLELLPTCNSYTGYDIIMLTGGEPMLNPELVINTIVSIKKETKAPIYLYTAFVGNILGSLYILNIIDGMTLTLHEQSDVEPFEKFSLSMELFRPKIINKSLRLNVFKGVNFPAIDWMTKDWEIKDNIEWIRNCPLPTDEILMRLK